MAAKRSKAARAGVAVGVGMKVWDYAKRVDWPAVWLRARWLTHHTKRLYNNLNEEERREFFALVVPTRERPIIPREDRSRVTELVTKAFTGGQGSGGSDAGGNGPRRF